VTPRHQSGDRLRDPRPEAGPFARLRLWLAPGMGVKRHVAIAVLGALLATIGAVAGALWVLADARAAVAAPVEDVLVSSRWRMIGGWSSLGALLAGIWIAIEAIARLNRSLLSNWLPRPRDAAVVLHRRLQLSRGPRIVAFGGGTGLSNLLRGLRQASSNLTAVVTVADDGGSSGRLRRAFGMPAPGDLSDCLAALSDDEVEVSRLMEYRFVRGGEFEGHTFGNLLITTLSEVEGDIGSATRVLNRLLNLSGAVWPVTDRPVTLVAYKEGEERLVGESHLREAGGPILRLELEPNDPPAIPEVIRALDDAELVVLGPGSLFTSVVAPLLVPKVREALVSTSAPLVYVCNIMTEAGETDGFDAFAHAEAVKRHLGRWPDLVLINDRPIDADRLDAYRGESGEGLPVRNAPLLGAGRFAQHDSGRLADELIALALAVRAGEAVA